MINFKITKSDFPIFKNNPNLVYLDSTATSLKPQSVIKAENKYYQNYSANIFRGVYKISEKATYEYETSRVTVAQFINAYSKDEIVFTRNTTESINLVAYAWGRLNIEKDDEVVTTIMEHHSNFIPWQQLAFENQADFKIIDIDENGQLNYEPIDKIITKKTKLLAIAHISNVLGTINPIKKIIAQAKKINPQVIIFVDGAQAVPHMKVDVRDLGCDFYAFSSHKMLGPTGVGVLWGKKELLNEMSPFMYGGEMIKEVTLNETIFADSPHRFEAGTPNIAGVIGLKAAIEYLNKFNLKVIHEYEMSLAEKCILQLESEFAKEIIIYGPKNERAGIVSFTFGQIHAHDIAQILDEDNICVRAGHHCAMPLHDRLQVHATVRASFYIYNTEEDINKLILSLKRVKKILS